MSAPQHLPNIKTDLTGQRFGRLLVLGYSHKDGRSKAYWHVQCDCGGRKAVQGYNLGRTVHSCGCLQAESRATHSVTHGMRGNSTYNVWAGMIQRCTNPNFSQFNRYGGRGIGVPDKWRVFAGFLEDMGERPGGMTIERLDNDAGYSNDNCRWASQRDQARNRSTTHWVEHEGVRLPLVAWADRAGIKYKVLHARLVKYGWPIERALTTPVR